MGNDTCSPINLIPSDFVLHACINLVTGAGEGQSLHACESNAMARVVTPLHACTTVVSVQSILSNVVSNKFSETPCHVAAVISKRAIL